MTMMNTNMIYKACGWALAVALLTACSDEPGLSDGQPAGPHVNLNVSSGLQPASRTILQGEQNAQHVTRVSLYAYKHTDANNALNATYIGGMSFGEVDWQQDIETAMKKDGTSSQQQLVALPESWGIDEDHPENMSATYTLLAIGSDDITDDGTVGGEFLGSNSTAAYGLDNSSYTPGATIGESYAILQNNKTLDDIHHSELFAGTLTVKGSALYSGRVIILNRRVAGVKGYFVRIPEKVKNQKVKELRVVYWAAQPTSVPYYKRESEEGKFMDYGGKPANSSLIPDIDSTMQAGDLDKCTYFKIGRDAQTGEFVSQPGAEIEVDKGQEGTDEEVVIPLTAGSYVLPAPGAPAPGAVGDDVTTLYVVLVSEPDAGKVTILDKRRVFFVTSYESRAATRSDNTDDGTGIIVGQDGNAESQETERRYPIVANNYYTIGTPQEPIDMSNGESDVYLYVDPRWEGIKDLGTIIGKPNGHNQQ